MSSRYMVPRPRWPVSTWLLAVTVMIGLVALFLAAFHAFGQVMAPVQAAAAALLIEVGMVVEAISFIRGRNWLAGIALVVSLTVSGTYNYIQASAAGTAIGITNWWQLLSLAVGPLSALTFLAMALGRELRANEAAVRSWEFKRQEWFDQERKRQERRADRLARKQAAIDRQLSDSAGPNGYLTDKQASFARGYAGFAEYVDYLTRQKRSLPDKSVIAQEMGRSERTIERYLKLYEKEDEGAEQA